MALALQQPPRTDPSTPGRDHSPQHDAAPRSSIPTHDDTALAMLSAPEPDREDAHMEEPVESQQPADTAFTIDQPLQTPDYSVGPLTARTPPQSRSRQNSVVFPLFHSSLPYALVRDFAYPPFNPLHYGPLDYASSGRSTPTFGGDYYDSTRRLSDPSQPANDRGLGPWRDSSFDQTIHPATQHLPSTSFAHGLGPGHPDETGDDSNPQRRYSKHRKSKSYTSVEDLGRGRQRTSGDGFKRTSRSAFGTDQNGGDDLAWRRTSSLSRQLSQDDQQTPVALSDRARLAVDPAFATQHPPFREDGDQVPYSPQDQEDHRPESASLDESFAGPSLALYDFQPEHDNELVLREGQIIQVGYRHGLGWLVAMDPETGEQGLVPEEYVRLLRDIEGWGEEQDVDADNDADAELEDTTTTTTISTVADDLAEANRRRELADGHALDGSNVDDDDTGITPTAAVAVGVHGDDTLDHRHDRQSSAEDVSHTAETAAA